MTTKKHPIEFTVKVHDFFNDTIVDHIIGNSLPSIVQQGQQCWCECSLQRDRYGVFFPLHCFFCPLWPKTLFDSKKEWFAVKRQHRRRGTDPTCWMGRSQSSLLAALTVLSSFYIADKHSGNLLPLLSLYSRR